MTIGRYADAKFEYLSYCLKVKEMDDEEQSYHSLQEPSYRVETGNYEYRYEPSHWNQSHWNQSHCSMLQYFFDSTWLYLTLLYSTLPVSFCDVVKKPELVSPPYALMYRSEYSIRISSKFCRYLSFKSGWHCSVQPPSIDMTKFHPVLSEFHSDRDLCSNFPSSGSKLSFQ